MSERGDLVRPDGPAPTHGLVGPVDPNADPPTEPGLHPHGGSPDSSDAAEPERGKDRTLFSGLYVGLILAALVLIFLLVFIVQNDAPAQINFLWMSGTLPTGVAILLAAVAGVLLVAIPGSGRIMQLRRAARRTNRTR